MPISDTRTLIGVFSSADDIIAFIAKHPGIKYAVELSYVYDIWIFSDSYTNMLDIVANFNWDSCLEKNDDSPFYNKNKEIIKIINDLRNRFPVDHKEDFLYTLASALFFDNSLLKYFDLMNKNYAFNDYMNLKRKEEEYDKQTYDASIQEEYEEYSAEKHFENKLKGIARNMSTKLSKEHIFDLSFLEKIILDNEDVFREFNLFGQKRKYIASIDENAAINAIVNFGTQNKIADKNIFSQPDNYAALIMLYKKFIPTSVIRGWKHMIDVLKLLKKKTTDSNRKIQLENYIEQQKLFLLEYQN